VKCDDVTGKTFITSDLEETANNFTITVGGCFTAVQNIPLTKQVGFLIQPCEVALTAELPFKMPEVCHVETSQAH
jgi:hypothetical protein